MSFPKFALNRIIAPKLSFDDYLKLCASLGIDAIEVRSDLPGVDLFDHSQHAKIVELCKQHNIKILTINALFHSDIWNSEREEQAIQLAKVAQNIGAEAILLCPLKDPADARTQQQRQQDLRNALTNLKPIFEDHNVLGYVEPFGFPQAALRLKKDAVEAINAVNGKEVFKLVHDTFHHHLAEDTDFFPEMTGIVHISGVIDKKIGIDKMLDGHRHLVDDRDLLENIAQLKRLKALGYTGYVSYEPFAETVHNMKDIGKEIKESMDFIRKSIA